MRAAIRKLYHSYRSWNWERRAAAWPSTPDGKRLLHIGCGDVAAPYYINLDARPLPHVHLVRKDLTDLSMIPDASLDLVYMCHVLEHVGRMQLLLTVQEMARVLKPGGILRIAVPDLDHIIHLYQACGKDLKVVAPALMGGQDYPYNFHYSAFNAGFLADLLQRGGFTEVRPWDPATASYHGFKDWASGTIPWSGGEHPISLNLEGVKR
jgi:predicted SAM-dependent methyltransferase